MAEQQLRVVLAKKKLAMLYNEVSVRLTNT